MSLDKLVDSTQLDADLTSIANAIRAKSGGSGQLAFPVDFVSEIGNIPSGGGGGENIAVAFHNARTSGSCTFAYPQFNETLGALVGNSASVSVGKTSNCVILVVGGVISFKANAAISTISYNGITLPKTSTGSGGTRFYSVTLPSDFVSGGTLDFD